MIRLRETERKRSPILYKGGRTSLSSSCVTLNRFLKGGLRRSDGSQRLSDFTGGDSCG